MYTYKIGVCDDEPVFCNHLKKLLAAYQVESKNQLGVRIFHRGEDLIDSFLNEKCPYDMLMLDVDVPNGMNGVQTATKIREQNPDVIIIFITNYEKYALDAYRVDAIDYLVKPVDLESLRRVMAKAIIQVDYILDYQKSTNRYLPIVVDYDRINIEISKILYIEKRRNQSLIHTEDGDYSCYETLSQLYEKLDSNKFMYVHQGFIVQFPKIKEVEKNCICFSGHVKVPVSRKYQKEVQQRFQERLYRLREQMLKKEATVPKIEEI